MTMHDHFSYYYLSNGQHGEAELVVHCRHHVLLVPYPQTLSNHMQISTWPVWTRSFKVKAAKITL